MLLEKVIWCKGVGRGIVLTVQSCKELSCVVTSLSLLFRKEQSFFTSLCI